MERLSGGAGVHGDLDERATVAVGTGREEAVDEADDALETRPSPVIPQIRTSASLTQRKYKVSGPRQRSLTVHFDGETDDLERI